MQWGRMLEDGSVVECSRDECNALYFHLDSDPDAKLVNFSVVGPVRVSTVFLGMNHGSPDAPLWFETLVFRDAFDDIDGRRSADRAEALKTHRMFFRRARSGWYD